ncbi:MAG: GAF domain-containing protein [bacterium]
MFSMMANGVVPTPPNGLRLVRNFSDLLAKCSDLHEILQKLVDDVVTHLGFEMCAVILRDEENPRRLFMAAAHGLSAEHQKLFSLAVGEGITGQVVATGEPRIVPVIHREPAYRYPGIAIIEQLCAMASIPLRHHEHVWGTLNIYTGHHHDFSEDEINLLTILADWTAFALHNAEQREAKEQRQRNLIEEIILKTQSFHALDKMIPWVLQKSATLVRGDFGSIAFVDYERMRFHPVYGYRRRVDNILRFRIGSLHEGIAGAVVRRGQSEIVDDVNADPRTKIRGDHRIKSKVLVPLRYQSQIIGVLSVDSRHKANFREEDQKNLEVLAGHLALIFQKQKLDQAFQALGQAFRTIHDLNEIYSTVVRSAADFVGTNAVALWEKDGNGGFLLRACVGFERFKARNLKIPSGLGLISEVIARRDVAVIENVSTNQQYVYPEMIAHVRPKWLVCIPIFFGNEVFAVLDVYSRRPHTFFEQEIDYLKALAVQAGVAIQNAKLIDHFNRIGQNITSSLDLKAILANITHSALEVLLADPVTLFQYDQTAGRLLPPPIYAGELLVREEYVETFVFTGHSFAELVIQNGESLYIEKDINRHPLMIEVKKHEHEGMAPQRFHERERIESMAAIVLKVEHEMVGLMFLNYRTPQKFSNIEKKIMETFASHAAIAIKNSRLIEQLHKNEAFLKSVITDIPDPLIVTENTFENGRRVWYIAMANQVAHEMFGYNFTTKELVAKDARTLFGDQLSRLREALRENNGEVLDFETSFLHKNGFPVPISLSTSVLQRDDENRILKTISVGKNLTSRKALEKQLDHLNRATILLLGARTLKQAYDAIFENLRQIGYAKGMIALVEEASHTIVAQRAEGEKWKKIVELTKIDLDSNHVLAEVVRQGEHVLIGDCSNDPRCDATLTRVAEVKSQYVTPLIAQDKVIGTLQIDLSDHQDLLKGDKYFLAESLKVLSGFANQIAVAIEADRHKITIDKLRLKLADAGHEFRSPLHIIIAQLGGLKYHLEKKHGEDAQMATTLRIVHEEAYRATRQMTNTLFSTVHSLEAMGINLEKGYLSKTIKLCVDRFFETAQKRGVRIIVFDSVKKLPFVFYDKTKLEQVFTNLLDNAVKYSHDHQNIEIKGREVGRKIEIAILDRGLGIPENQYERIFQGFARSEVLDSTRYIPGTGLGLTIAREFVEQHKGKIWVRSVPFMKDPRKIRNYEGYETTVFVLLPFNPKEV